MPYHVYRLAHFFGIFLVLLSLGGIALHVINGGTRQHPARKFIAIVHGTGLLLALVAGFGMLARLGLVTGLPGWAYLKLGVWLVLGALPAVLYRAPARGRELLLLIVALAGLAAWAAQMKPF